MKKEKIKINNIPSIIWGEKSSKIFIAMHGNMSNKEDKAVEILSEIVSEKGYQILSFDLPEHGERKDNHDYLCKVQNCIKDLEEIYNYVLERYDEINIWACSMSAYFSLIGLKDKKINKAILLSPVIDMYNLIQKMMNWASVNEEELKDKKVINTNFGITLYYDYYEFVKNNPVDKCFIKTDIICGNKDDMQDLNSLKHFSRENKCRLYILTDGEHYFHNEYQLDYYKACLEDIFN